MDVRRKSGVQEVLGTGETMELSIGLAASGATWEVRVAGSLVLGKVVTSMKKFTW